MSDLTLEKPGPLPILGIAPRETEDSTRVLPAERLCMTLRHECEVMLHHALKNDKEIPPDVARQLGHALSDPSAGADGAAQIEMLVQLHGQLSALVAPACGRTLVLFDEERQMHPRLYVFGPVRLVRQMLALAMMMLLSTCLLSTFDVVNDTNVAAGWFAVSGEKAFGVLGFLLAAAGLGSIFSNLSTMSRYIEQANYDVTYEGSYWTRFVLGLISGVVLGEILFDLAMKPATASTGTLSAASERIVFAFLGGFATPPVQRLLTNLSDALGTLLQGDGTQTATPRRSAPIPAPVPSEPRKE